MPKNLLLADDSITIQKVVGITFAGEDYRVTAVDNGEDALARARDLRPDVILADVVMPRRNGYELCQAVKADPQLARVPVILLAGTFEAFDEARARQARADGHIAKPFDSQALINKVREVVEGVAPARTAPPAARPATPAPTARPAAPAPAAPRPYPTAVVPAQVPQPRPQTAPGMPAGRPPVPGAPPGPAPYAPRPGPPASRPGMPAMPGAPPAGRSPVPPPPSVARPAAPAPPRPSAAPAPPRPTPVQAPLRAATPAPMPAAGPPPPAARPYAPAQPPPGPAAAGRGVEARPTGQRPVPIPPPGAVPARSPPPAPAAPGRRDPYGLDVEAPRVAPAEDWLSVDLAAEARAADAAGAPLREPPVRPPGAVPPVSPAGPGLAPLVGPSELDFREEAFGVQAGAGRPAPAAAEAAPIEIPEVDLEEEVPLELAPVHAFVPPPGEVGHRPEPAPAPRPAAAPEGAAPADGGEALLREALSRASRDVIERIAWEVVPQLAETIIKEHLERLVRERQGQ